MSLTEDFLARRLDPAGFDHQAHVRVAWDLLQRFPFQRAFSEFEAGVRDLATRAGAPGKYHATITRALLHLIRLDLENSADPSWLDYLRSKPGVIGNGKALLLRHYSEAVLFSEQARLSWCEPDLAPWPAFCAARHEDAGEDLGLTAGQYCG